MSFWTNIARTTGVWLAWTLMPRATHPRTVRYPRRVKAHSALAIFAPPIFSKASLVRLYKHYLGLHSSSLRAECDSCGQEPHDNHQVGDGLLICPPCYVEGRSCKCQSMQPAQHKDFGVLLQDRNRAANILLQSDSELRLPCQILLEGYVNAISSHCKC